MSKTKRKLKVLFICVHNSARGQMAEALLNNLAGDEYEATSAELEPGELNPFVVEVLREIGIDISGKKTQSAFELYKSGQFFPYVIAVCDESNGEKCPIFPGVTKRLDWSLPDPSKFTGTGDEILKKTRQVRNMIETKIREFSLKEKISLIARGVRGLTICCCPAETT